MPDQRKKGHNYERKVVREINAMDSGYFVGSSRAFSRYMDSKGVDIVDVPESTKKFPFHIQCKSYTGYYKYNHLFKEFSFKDRPLVVFHQLTEKHGNRFVPVGEYVIMEKQCFYNLVNELDDKDE